MGAISLRNVVKRYGIGPKANQVIHGVNAEIADGEFVVIVGPSGCGKSTLLRMVAGLEEITGGEICDRRPRRQRPRAVRARHRDGVPELRALPAHDGLRQHGVRPEDRQGARGRDQGARRQGGGDPRARAVPAEKAARALGRAAPARRDGPRDRAPAGGVPVRRAALQPRRQAARADAARDPEAAPRAAHDLALRHPRPGRGDDAGRADDRHERRPHGADRHARRGLPPAGDDLRRRLHRLAADEPGARPRAKARASPPAASCCRCRRRRRAPASW